MSASTAVPTATWAIDPVHSSIGFGVKHLGVSTYRGSFTGASGTTQLSLCATGSYNNPGGSLLTNSADGTLVTFVLFYRTQVAVNGYLADQGWVPPTLERLFPVLLGQQVLTFVLYAIILDFADYWRHWLAHRFRWWWALHSLHHAQRQMTFWSDDRNHIVDDVIAFVWFGAIALTIGVPPLQFPLLVLVLRFLESKREVVFRLDRRPAADIPPVSSRASRNQGGGGSKLQLRFGAALVGYAVPDSGFQPFLCTDGRS